jgi:PKD repeat protein
LRKRQTPLDQITPEGLSSPRQRTSEINIANSTVPGLQNMPSNYFEPGTVGRGLNGTGLLKARPNIEITYKAETTKKGAPLLNKTPTYIYFFIEYSNLNTKGISGLLKSFSIVKTLNQTDLKTFSQMLGAKAKTITPIDKYTYDNGSFTHPKYINDNGQPLSIRYAELAMVKQVTPGRLDDAPIGYPDFDTTPDGVINIVSPIPGPPYTTFSALGATSTFTVYSGGTVFFLDKSPKTPWQTAPTGWNWSFGTGANPTGSTQENPEIVYSDLYGPHNVTLTASNAHGSTTLIKNGFIIVNDKNFITEGLTLYLDAGNSLSYSGSGSVWYDVSGNNNHFNLYNSPTYSSNLLDFNGTNQYAMCQNNTCGNFGTGSFTIEYVINFGTTSSYSTIIAKRAGTTSLGTNGWAGFVHRIGAPVFTVQDNLTNGSVNVTGVQNNASSITSGQIQHIVQTITNVGTTTTMTGKLYKNGVLLNTSTYDYSLYNGNPQGSVNNTNNILLMLSPGLSTYLQSSLYYVRLYSKALSDTEIQKNYTTAKNKYGI